MGGTFNPVHNAHLFIAEEAREVFSLSKVIFVPNKIPPHRSLCSSSLLDRINMLKLALSSNNFFDLSLFELDRDCISYSIDTVKYFFEKYPKTPLYFITGTDSLLKYDWKSLEDLIDMLEAFISLSRPKYSKELLFDRIKTKYPDHYHKIIIFDSLFLEISSSDIRKRIKEGRSIKYLVPEGVEKYILENGLYRDSE